MDPTYPLFPIFSFIGFFLVLIPLPWHFRALNAGTCLFMIWTATGCLIQFINSIVWRGNFRDSAPLWCDISTRLVIGIAVAIPAASLCINRRLYKIATCHAPHITYASRKRAILVDLSIGLGIPFSQMALQFIVQGHRYDIYEDIGCRPTTVNTPPAYPLSFLWPNVTSLISGGYCILTLRAFMSRRAQFGQLLSSSSSLTVNHYFRLMCLATTEILFTIPISSYGLYLNAISTPIYPWKSWSDIHFDWYTLNIYPAALWRSSRVFTIAIELNQWLLIICAFVFFAFFGFADEALRNYRSWYTRVANYFRPRPCSNKAEASKSFQHVVLPLHNLSTTSSASTKANFDMSNTSRDSFHSALNTDFTETLRESPDITKIEFKKYDNIPISPSRRSRMTI